MYQTKSSLYSRYYAEACHEWRAHLRCLTPGQLSSEEISRRWRAVGDTVTDSTGPGIEPPIFRTDGVRLTTELTGRSSHVPPGEKELDCFTRKASKGRFLLFVVAYGLTFYCS